MARFSLVVLAALLSAACSVRFAEELDLDKLDKRDVEAGQNPFETLDINGLDLNNLDPNSPADEDAAPADEDVETEALADDVNPEEDNEWQEIEKRAQTSRNFADNIFGRNTRLNAAQEQARMVDFVLQTNETVLAAFRTWRVHTYFTTYRILFKRGRLFHPSRASYTSLSYDVIKAWSMRSSGKGMHKSTAVKVWTSVQSDEASILNMTFRNTTKDDEDMLLDVNQVLTKMVLGEDVEDNCEKSEDPEACRNFGQFGQKWSWSNFFWFWNVGLHSKQIDDLGQTELDNQLRTRVPVLGKTEQVRLAFQIGRDYEVYTNKRLILIDTQYWTGQVVEYRSIPWAEASVWGIKTAEIVDVASDLSIYTSIPGLPHSSIKVKPTFQQEYDLMRVCSEQVMHGQVDPLAALPNKFPSVNPFFRIHSEQVGPAVMEPIFRHEVPGLLNQGEGVETAMLDRRDTTTITNQRLIKVRRAGFMSMEFQSVPWRAARAFTVRYDDGWFMKRGEFRIYTGVRGEVVCDTNTRTDSNGNQQTSQENCHVIDGMGKMVHKFWGIGSRQLGRAGMSPDVPYLHRLLSERILGKVDESQRSVADDMPARNGKRFDDSLHQWLRGKSGERPNEEAQDYLHGEFLLPGEQVTYALRLRRNTMVMTAKRIILFQRFGLFGRGAIEYSSFPWRSVVAFQSRSAGTIRIGGELRFWTSTPAWRMHRFGISLFNGMYKATGAAKQFAKHVLLTARNGYQPPDSSSLVQGGIKPMQAIHWLFGNMGNMNKDEAEARIKAEAPLLTEEGEEIKYAFRTGRDMLVLTNLRILFVDVQWFSGKSVQFRSLPYAQCRMWSVDLGSTWHTVNIWTDVHRTGALKKVTARFQAATVDAGTIDNFLRDKILVLNEWQKKDAQREREEDLPQQIAPPPADESPADE